MIFIESPAFERLRGRHLDDDQYRLLQFALYARPDRGDLIQGSGGLRKLRWSEPGRGKRGGLRVIYYWITREDQILMLTVYRKSEMTDLTPSDIRVLKALVDSLEG